MLEKLTLNYFFLSHFTQVGIPDFVDTSTFEE